MGDAPDVMRPASAVPRRGEAVWNAAVDAVIPGVAQAYFLAALPVNALRRAVRFYDLPLVQSAWLWQNRLSALALASFAVLAVQGDGQTSKNVKNCRFMVKRTDSSDLTSSKAKVKKRGRGQPARTSPSTVPVEPKRQIS